LLRDAMDNGYAIAAFNLGVLALTVNVLGSR